MLDRVEVEHNFVFAHEAQVEALCNTPDAVIRENVRVNARRLLPWVRITDAHAGHAVICGSGPSLADMLDEISARASAGQTIFALNGAADFLADHGIRPDFLVMIDARPENVKFIARRSARKYLIASQCAPAVFDALVDAYEVRLFHCAMDNIVELLPRTGREESMISGAHTSGLMALSLVGTLGFRNMHLYGYDSSDRGEASHAFAQDETSAERKRLTVKFGDVVYSTSFAMYKQAEAFPQYAQMLADAGVTISVHGNGLLPAIAHDMVRPCDHSLAVYDFREAPASFDFTTWLIKAEMMRRIAGEAAPLRVKFLFNRDGSFRVAEKLLVPVEYREQIFHKVIRPALALVGAVEADEPAAEESGARYNYLMRDIVDAAREGHEVPRFEPLAEDLDAIDLWLARNGVTESPFVITLREAAHWPHRNSALADWLRFATDLEKFGPVVFVRDTEHAEEPLDGWLRCPAASLNIRVRCALYARARCNFMVANGPNNLAYFGRRPYLTFKNILDQTEVQYRPATPQWWAGAMGVSVGTQFPWADATQRIVWTSDDYASLRAAWDDLAPLLGA